MSEFKGFEIVNQKDEKKSKKFNFNFSENKYIFYTALFYAFGLFTGAYFYKIVGSEALDNVLEITDNAFTQLFLSDFCLYFSIFSITVFLGFCLFGKPVIYIVPVFIGIASGMRLSYYCLNYQAKGVGYSLIMIIPYIALFLTVISYTIDNGAKLSSMLITMTKGESNGKLELSPYLKKYLVYTAMIIVISLFDSAVTKLLFSVVTI